MSTLVPQSATVASIARRRQRRHLQAAAGVVAVLAVVPLTFIGNTFAGVQPSGAAWALLALCVTPVVLFQPLARQPVLRLAPYLCYLMLATISLGWSLDIVDGLQQTLQLAVPALVYLLAWRLPSRLIIARTAPLARVLLVVAAALVVMDSVVGEIGPFTTSTRPLAVALCVLVVLATVDAERVVTVVGWGALAIATGMLSGSRTASAVVVVLLLTHRLVALDWRRRVALGLIAIGLLLAISQTSAFRDRFFFDEDATLADIFTLSENVNTAGRRELWPRLAADCGQVPVFGHGVGSSYVLSERYTAGAMPQPHNEPLRVFCDSGLVGSVLFWWFPIAVSVRAVRWGGFADAIHGAALQAAIVLLLIGMTDNPIVYTGHFMAPAALIWGASDRRATEQARIRGAIPQHP